MKKPYVEYFIIHICHMDKKKLIANWKSNKTAEETIVFLDGLKEVLVQADLSNKEIIILPSFLSIPAAAAYIEEENLPIQIGTQDISAQDVGAFTGSVNGAQIAEFCQFALINHSERRRYNHEADQEARSKVLMAQKYNLIPLYCIQDEAAGVPDGVIEVMFEPPTSISTFQEGAKVTESSEIERVFSILKKNIPQGNFYYGGSVNPDNIKELLQVPQISGFLVGSASLDIESFAELILSW